MKKNELGLTLVEVLVTLVLLSVVGTLIWTTFFISAKHNVAETSKAHLQQEANYILAEIQQQHRKLDCYKLEITSDKVRLLDCEDPNNLIKVISSNYNYMSNSLEEITPKIEDLELMLEVIDPVNEKLKVNISTTIARYKSD